VEEGRASRRMREAARWKRALPLDPDDGDGRDEAVEFEVHFRQPGVAGGVVFLSGLDLGGGG